MNHASLRKFAYTSHNTYLSVCIPAYIQCTSYYTHVAYTINQIKHTLPLLLRLTLPLTLPLLTLPTLPPPNLLHSIPTSPHRLPELVFLAKKNPPTPLEDLSQNHHPKPVHRVLPPTRPVPRPCTMTISLPPRARPSPHAQPSLLTTSLPLCSAPSTAVRNIRRPRRSRRKAQEHQRRRTVRAIVPAIGRKRRRGSKEPGLLQTPG